MLETLKNINEIRREVGLQPIVWKKVRCLGCDKGFVSHDYPRQRMCLVCRRHTDDTTPVQDFMLTG